MLGLLWSSQQIIAMKKKTAANSIKDNRQTGKNKMKISSLKEAHPKTENQPPINNEADGGFLAGTLF